MEDAAPTFEEFEAENRRVFEGLCALGPLTSAAKAVWAHLREAYPGSVVCFLPDVVDDYLRKRLGVYQPLFGLPPADVTVTKYLDAGDCSAEDRKALSWVLPLLAVTNSNLGRFLERFGERAGRNLKYLSEQPAMALRPDDWPGFWAGRRNGLIYDAAREGTCPYLQWVYPWSDAATLAGELLLTPGEYVGPGGSAVVLLPGDPRSLPLLQAVNDAKDGPPEEFDAAVSAALITTSERGQLDLIQHIRREVTLGKNRAEIVESYVLAKGWPDLCCGSIDKQITRLLPRLRRDMPGFDWPKRRRPKNSLTR